MENKMQQAECAKEIYSINWPCTQDKPIKITLKQMEAILTAAEIVRNHVDIVRCGECIYHHEIPCPVDIDMDTPTPDDWYCPCGVKMDGERKDGEKVSKFDFDAFLGGDNFAAFDFEPYIEPAKDTIIKGMRVEGNKTTVYLAGLRKGVATCSPSDIFDPIKGVALAYMRALGQTVDDIRIEINPAHSAPQEDKPTFIELPAQRDQHVYLIRDYYSKKENKYIEKVCTTHFISYLIYPENPVRILYNITADSSWHEIGNLYFDLKTARDALERGKGNE